ncbi:MAG: hypothetical protein HY075_04735 [Deltaproteobacteria bacterium]|nr:hypothetical protein [Deltaproteobacteria bacterium]
MSAAPRPSDASKPLIYHFREGASPSAEMRPMLEGMGLRCELFNDPRALLLSLKNTEPAICLLDFSTAKIDVVTAVLRTIRSVLGEKLPIIALVPKGFQEKSPQLFGAKGATAAVERPVVPSELAQRLSYHVVTDALAAMQTESSGGLVLEEVPTPAVVTWLLDHVVPALVKIGAYVKFFDESERQLKFYTEKLEPFQDELIEMIKKLRRREEKVDLNQTLRLYGVANTRNLLTTMAVANATVPDSFAFDAKSGMPNHDPKAIIPYAIKLLERLGGEGSRFYQIAFSAGLVFDLLNRIANNELGERKRPIQRMIEAAFADGLRRIEKGLKLGKEVDDLAMAKHIISTIMMREAGKIVMAMVIVNYPEVRKFFEKKVVSHAFQLIAEQENFDVSHNLVGALLCQAAPNLSEAFQAVLFCDVQVTLKAPGDRQIQDLAAFCRSL